MSYEYLEHTADKKIKASGKDLAEAFGEGALAVYNIILNTKKVEAVRQHRIEIESESKKALLYDFIDELLYILDVEGFVACKIKSIEIKEKKLTAFLVGDSYRNYDHHGDVKAMTYNEMDIKEEKGKATIIFVVDV